MLRVYNIDDTLFVALSGRLDLGLVYEFAEAATLVTDSCTTCWLDVRQVTEITDGGLSLLTMFIRHTQKSGLQLHLESNDIAISRRIAAIPMLHQLLPCARQDRQRDGSGGRITRMQPLQTAPCTGGAFYEDNILFFPQVEYIH